MGNVQGTTTNRFLIAETNVDLRKSNLSLSLPTPWSCTVGPIR